MEIKFVCSAKLCFSLFLHLVFDLCCLLMKVHLAQRVPVGPKEAAELKERGVILVLLALPASLDRRESLVLPDSQ